MVEQKQKTSKLIILLIVTFMICFGLWVKAYSSGAIATPPAVLVFGPPTLTTKSEIPIRIVAMNAIKRQRLTVDSFGLDIGDGEIKDEHSGDFGLLSAHIIKSNKKNALQIKFKESELPLRVPISFEGNANRAFDGFRWNELQADYAARLSGVEMSFYPLWGSVSSSLDNPGFFFKSGKIRRTEIAANPASVFDPMGFKMVLDRVGFGVQGPAGVMIGSNVVYQLRSYESGSYFCHAWLNDTLVDMRQLRVSQKETQIVFEVPQNAQEGDAFWVSVTQSPWLDVQGKAFVSRVSAQNTTDLKEHLTWLSSRSGEVPKGDKLFRWLQKQETVENQDGVLQALHSRLAPPFYQAPIINALPKVQMAAFEQRKAAQLKVWRHPFRVSAIILCLLALVWVRQEVIRHLSWKSELVDFHEVSSDIELKPKTWKDKVPWHNLWGLMAFFFICGLFWVADWILGLTLNDYQF